MSKVNNSIKTNSDKIDLFATPREYFSDLVQEAIEKRRLEVQPMTTCYLIQILENYLVTENMHHQGTLAELYMKSFHVERQMRIDILKKLGDTSLYVAGFFGDSLRRKIIDIDYYRDIGGVAYESLSQAVDDELQAHLYKDVALRFVDYADIFTYISQSARIQSNQDLLRLYERYVATGSELAKEQLVEKGLLTNVDKKRHSQ